MTSGSLQDIQHGGFSYTAFWFCQRHQASHPRGTRTTGSLEGSRQEDIVVRSGSSCLCWALRAGTQWERWSVFFLLPQTLSEVVKPSEKNSFLLLLGAPLHVCVPAKLPKLPVDMWTHWTQHNRAEQPAAGNNEGARTKYFCNTQSSTNNSSQPSHPHTDVTRALAIELYWWLEVSDLVWFLQ